MNNDTKLTVTWDVQETTTYCATMTLDELLEGMSAEDAAEVRARLAQGESVERALQSVSVPALIDCEENVYMRYYQVDERTIYDVKTA
jgi:hypothetical protein